MLALVAYVDGGSLGNPGPAGIGVVIDGGLDGTIRIAKAKKLHVYSDSEVVVRQMKGEYSCRSPRLYSLNWICRKLARSLHFSISHIHREHNAEANHLASSAVRKRLVRKSAI